MLEGIGPEQQVLASLLLFQRADEAAQAMPHLATVASGTKNSPFYGVLAAVSREAADAFVGTDCPRTKAGVLCQLGEQWTDVQRAAAARLHGSARGEWFKLADPVTVAIQDRVRPIVTDRDVLYPARKMTALARLLILVHHLQMRDEHLGVTPLPDETTEGVLGRFFRNLSLHIFDLSVMRSNSFGDDGTQEELNYLRDREMHIEQVKIVVQLLQLYFPEHYRNMALTLASYGISDITRELEQLRCRCVRDSLRLELAKIRS